MKRFGQLWRIVIAFVVSTVLNGFLLAIAFSIDPKREKLSGIETIANNLLKPAAALTQRLMPGHTGAQIAGLFIFSLLVYTLVAWVVVSLPLWWRHRA
jgi:hypothetical protein